MVKSNASANLFYMWVMKSEYEADNTIVDRDPFEGFKKSTMRGNRFLNKKTRNDEFSMVPV